MRIKQILIIIFVLTIASFIGYRFGLSQSGQFFKSIVEPGSMVTEASYVIFKDDMGFYYARNGLTGEIEYKNNDVSYIINELIPEPTSPAQGSKIDGNVLLFFKVGTYEINNKITIRTEGIEFAGENMNGVVFDMGPNGQFFWDNSQTNWKGLHHYRFENIRFDGSDATIAAIDTSGMDDDERVGFLHIIRCRFDNWTATSDELTNYAILGANPEWWILERSIFSNSPIKLYSKGYNAGNIRFIDNFIGVDNTKDVDGYNMVTITNENSNSPGSVIFSGNQWYTGASSKNIYGILLNGTYTPMRMTDYKSIGERGEMVELLRVYSYNSTYAPRDIEIADGRFTMGGMDGKIFIYLDEGIGRSQIHNNLFIGSGYTNESGIWTDSGVEIIGNRFTGLENAITGNGLPTIKDNSGYNPKGSISNPFATGPYRIVDWDGTTNTFSSGQTYTNYHSSKNIYIEGGDVTAIYVNNEQVFSLTNVTVHLEPGDRFKVDWSGTPTIKVIGE